MPSISRRNFITTTAAGFSATACSRVTREVAPLDVPVETHADAALFLNGGAMLGDTPDNSAVNRYLQSWDVSNVFVMGASAYPQNAGYNPTGTVGALTYWAAEAIRSRYLKNPGPLV